MRSSYPLNLQNTGFSPSHEHKYLSPGSATLTALTLRRLQMHLSWDPLSSPGSFHFVSNCIIYLFDVKNGFFQVSRYRQKGGRGGLPDLVGPFPIN